VRVLKFFEQASLAAVCGCKINALARCQLSPKHGRATGALHLRGPQKVSLIPLDSRDAGTG
jgi:hypothetical protein